ncbi:FG-GAP repeat domain-containing protein [Streptomyces sp. NBC_00454]|uniref:FG-GAP repeat domain-containing protein n=1 Tax=Streptomyces sp. NBC_00454 TaxID=2975747 RepID=UPI0030DF69AA
MRSTRSGRIAACTALALAAGMILSGPVSATEKPVPTAKTERPQHDDRATGTRPAAPATTKARVGAAAVTPLLDVDMDGYQDILYRGLSGKTYLKTFNDTTDPEFIVSGAAAGSKYDEDFKDVITPGDLDHDGHPELLTLSVDGQLSLLTAGKYDAQRTGWHGNGWNIYNKVVGAGDLNGDGNADLLARTPGGALYLYPGNGTANSGSPYGDRISLGGGWDMFSQILGGGDFNSDGKPDLVTVTPSGGLYVYPGTGNGAFGDRVQSGFGWNMYNQLQLLTSATGPSWIAARDQSGTMWGYPSDGAGGFTDRQKMGTGWEYTDLFAGQGGIAAHGRSELMARTGDGAVFAYSGKMNGGFFDRDQVLESGDAPIDLVGMTVASSFGHQNVSNWLIWGGGQLYSDNNFVGGGWDIYNSLVGVGDVNGDGLGDLLARDNSNVMWLYPSIGNGYQFRDRIRLGAGWGIYNRLLGAGDVTGDGRADLIARGNDGTLWVYPAQGASSFGDRIQVGSGWNGMNKLAAVGDITGDGLTDIVAVDSSGSGYLYKASGLKGMNTFGARIALGGGWNAYVDLQ